MSLLLSSFQLVFGESKEFQQNLEITQKTKMNLQVELIPITEGNQIVIKENEKVIIGRGSSLGV